MVSIARGFVCALVFVAVFLFSYWMVFAQFLSQNVAYVPAMMTAAAAAFLTWHVMRSANRGILGTALNWAAITGAAGFCVGFFGPMIFAPGANQGPMLGLFITGPLGFLAGGICGLVYAIWCRSNPKNA